jgi:hypothetical protein
MFGKSKNDPMLPAIKGIMDKNDAHRKAVEIVNEHFGITSRRALPLEEKAKYDIAVKKVLAGETIDDCVPVYKGMVQEGFGPDGRGIWKVNYTHPDKKNVGNDHFETEKEARRFAKSLKDKGYHDVTMHEGQRGSKLEETEKIDEVSLDTLLHKKRKSKLNKKLKLNENVLDAILEERKESGRVVDAFLAKKSIKGKRTHTDGESLYLHGNKIAWHNTDGSVHATMAGWGTVTTRERLNTLANRLGAPKFSQRKGTQYHGDKEIGSKDIVVLRAPTSKQSNLLESQGYSKSAVDKAIKASKKKIGGKEAKMIHALLKGRQKSDEPTVKEEVVAKGSTYHKDSQKWEVTPEKTYKFKTKSNVRALNAAIKKIQREHPGHKEYEAKIKGIKEDSNLTIACIQQEIAENLMKKYNMVAEDNEKLAAFNEALSEEQKTLLEQYMSARGVARAPGSPFAPNAPTLAKPFVGPEPLKVNNLPPPVAPSPAQQFRDVRDTANSQMMSRPVVPAPTPARKAGLFGMGGFPQSAQAPVAAQVNAPGYNPHSAEARAARPVVPANSPAVAARARADAATAPQSAQIATPAQTVPASAPTLTQTAAPATEPTTPASTPTEPAAVAQAPATKERSRSKSHQNQVRQRKVSAPMRPKKFGYGSDGSGRQDAGSITNRAFGAVNEEEQPMKRSLESILRDRYGH